MVLAIREFLAALTRRIAHRSLKHHVDLLALDEHTLKDIGVNRLDVVGR